jgi:uncharacterized membrane protein
MFEHIKVSPPPPPPKQKEINIWLKWNTSYDKRMVGGEYNFLLNSSFLTIVVNYVVMFLILFLKIKAHKILNPKTYLIWTM